MKTHSGQPIYIIDDDAEIAECLSVTIRHAFRELDMEAPVQSFSDALAAITAIDDDAPALIFLDVLLTGPNGFTFLNELASYTETAKIPIVIMSSLDLTSYDLRHYGVVKVLQKETMTPADAAAEVREFYGKNAGSCVTTLSNIDDNSEAIYAE